MAQLVEHNLAKVGVAGSSPVFRSIVNARPSPVSAAASFSRRGFAREERRRRGQAVRQGPAKPLSPVRFRSSPPTWAIGAAGARFPDTEEATGSIPVSPTITKPQVRRGKASDLLLFSKGSKNVFLDCDCGFARSYCSLRERTVCARSFSRALSAASASCLLWFLNALPTFSSTSGRSASDASSFSRTSRTLCKMSRTYARNYLSVIPVSSISFRILASCGRNLRHEAPPSRQSSPHSRGSAPKARDNLRRKAKGKLVTQQIGVY